MPNNPSDDDEVHLDIDHQIGSKLLTNFYRSIKFNKLNSNIITNIRISTELIGHTNHNSKLILSPPPQLLYRGTRDGFKAIDFHSRCDDQGPTLTIIKSASNEPFNQIFGGFTTQSWSSSSNGEWISDGSAFIFKIIDDKNSNQQQQLFKKFKIREEEKQLAIYANKHYLPVFGSTDLCICSDCNLNSESNLDFGYNYEIPPPSNDDDEFYKYESEKVTNYLAGSYRFKVLEIEVFKITTTTNGGQ